MRETGMAEPIITKGDIEKCGDGVLGPEYWASERAADELVRMVLPQEALDAIAKEAAKAVSEAVFGRISEFLWDGVLEHNMQLKAYQMVGDVIEAIISGNKALAQRYALDRFDQFGVRKAIAELIPDEVAQKRISDLEEEIVMLREQLKWSRI